MDYKNRKVAELVALISQEMAKTGLQKNIRNRKGCQIELFQQYCWSIKIKIIY